MSYPEYHFSLDRIVPRQSTAYSRNVDGPFYVSDQCITCGLPLETAPEGFAWDCSTNCPECPKSCYVKKQPENNTELNHMLKAMLRAETENIRYCGTNPIVLKKLMDAGYNRLCDALI